MPTNFFDNLPPDEQRGIVALMHARRHQRQLTDENSQLQMQLLQAQVNQLQAEAMAPSPEGSDDDDEADEDHVDVQLGGDLDEEMDSEDEAVASGVYRARPCIKPTFGMGTKSSAPAYLLPRGAQAPPPPTVPAASAFSSGSSTAPHDPAPPPIMWSQVQMSSTSGVAFVQQPLIGVDQIVAMAEDMHAERPGQPNWSFSSSSNPTFNALLTVDPPATTNRSSVTHPSATGANAVPVPEQARRVPMGPDGRYIIDVSQADSPPPFDAAQSTFTPSSPPPYNTKVPARPIPSHLPTPSPNPHPGTMSTASESTSVPAKIDHLVSHVAWVLRKPGAAEQHLWVQGEDMHKNHYLRHTQMMDRLLDPRLREADREFDMHPEDNFDTGHVIGLHRLPPAAEVQRAMLWSFVRMPNVPNLKKDMGAGAARKVYYHARKEKLHSEESLCFVSVKLERMVSFHRTISSAQAARPNAPKPGLFLDSELGQAMIETCLQLEHGHIVMQLIGLCLEIDVISSEQMSKDGIKQQYGPQFWYLLLDKAQRREWVSLGTAVEVANRLWKVALQTEDKGGNVMLVVSILLRAIAHLLPYFPSRWLMEPWEAKLNGLADTYIGILLDIGRQIEPIAQMYNSTYRVYTIVEQVVGLDGRQHGCSMDLLLRALGHIPRSQHSALLRGPQRYEDLKAYRQGITSQLQAGHDSLYRPYHNWTISGILSYKMRWYDGPCTDILEGAGNRKPFWHLDAATSPSERAIAQKWLKWAAEFEVANAKWVRSIEENCRLNKDPPKPPTRGEIDEQFESLKRMPREQAAKEVNQALQALDMASRAHGMASTRSHGQTGNAGLGQGQVYGTSMEIELELVKSDEGSAPMERTGQGSRGYLRPQRGGGAGAARKGAVVMAAQVRRSLQLRKKRDGGDHTRNISGQSDTSISVDGVVTAEGAMQDGSPKTKALSARRDPSQPDDHADGMTRGRTLQKGRGKAAPLPTRQVLLYAEEQPGSSGEEVEHATATIGQRAELDEGHRREYSDSAVPGDETASVTTHAAALTGNTVEDKARAYEYGKAKWRERVAAYKSRSSRLGGMETGIDDRDPAFLARMKEVLGAAAKGILVLPDMPSGTRGSGSQLAKPDGKDLEVEAGMRNEMDAVEGILGLGDTSDADPQGEGEERESKRKKSGGKTQGKGGNKGKGKAKAGKKK